MADRIDPNPVKEPGPKKAPPARRPSTQINRTASGARKAAPAKKANPVKRSTGKNRKYDWDKAMTMYVEGMPVDPKEPDGDRKYPTLKEIADHFGHPVSQYEVHSSQDRWPTMRAMWQKQVLDGRMRDRANQLSKEALAFDSQLLNSSKLGIQILMARLLDISRDTQEHPQKKAMLQARQQQGLPVSMTDLRHPAYHVEMLNIARALESLQNIGRRALGEDTQTLKLTGTGENGAVQVDLGINVSEELLREDPERMAKFLQAAAQADLFRDIIDADVIEEIEDDEGYEDDDLPIHPELEQGSKE